MTEEEKKAIEYLKNRLEILHNNTQWATENSIKVVLNLIEKQQKELEGQGLRLLELAHMLTFDYISKDKIKKLIKEIQETMCPMCCECGLCEEFEKILEEN